MEDKQDAVSVENKDVSGSHPPAEAAPESNAAFNFRALREAKEASERRLREHERLLEDARREKEEFAKARSKSEQRARELQEELEAVRALSKYEDDDEDLDPDEPVTRRVLREQKKRDAQRRALEARKEERRLKDAETRLREEIKAEVLRESSQILAREKLETLQAQLANQFRTEEVESAINELKSGTEWSFLQDRTSDYEKLQLVKSKLEATAKRNALMSGGPTNHSGIGSGVNVPTSPSVAVNRVRPGSPTYESDKAAMARSIRERLGI